MPGLHAVMPMNMEIVPTTFAAQAELAESETRPPVPERHYRAACGYVEVTFWPAHKRGVSATGKPPAGAVRTPPIGTTDRMHAGISSHPYGAEERRAHFERVRDGEPERHSRALHHSRQVWRLTHRRHLKGAA